MRKSTLRKAWTVSLVALCVIGLMVSTSALGWSAYKTVMLCYTLLGFVPGAQAAGVVQVVLWLADEAFGIRLSQAESNPDPNYTEVPVSVPFSFSSISLPDDPDLEQASNNVLDTLSDILADGRALVTAVERYYGALEFSQPPARRNYAVRQRAAALGFLADIEANLQTLADQFEVLSTFPVYANATLTHAQIIALQNDLLINGLPPHEVVIFNEMGGTPEELAIIMQSYASIDLSELSDPITGLELLVGTIEGMQDGSNLNPRASLPASFPLTPRPPQTTTAIPLMPSVAIAVLVVAFLLVAIWGLRRRA